MADNIDFTNEDFQYQYMKPVAGEEINALWGRLAAGNTGHLYYAMPPFLNFDLMFLGTTTRAGTMIKRFVKPAIVGTYIAYIDYVIRDSGYSSAILYVDGTSIFGTGVSGVSGSTITFQDTATFTVGNAGVTEMLTATLNISAKKAGVSVVCYPDWSKI